MATKPRTADTTAPAAAPATTSVPDAEKKARKPRGPRGPAYEWTKERKMALAEVLHTPKAKGTLRTAASVAAALVNHPAFEDAVLVAAKDVLSYVRKLVAKYEAKDEAIPPHLIFDRQRKTSVAEEDLDLFR